jgi:hypothetical protein
MNAPRTRRVASSAADGAAPVASAPNSGGNPLALSQQQQQRLDTSSSHVSQSSNSKPSHQTQGVHSAIVLLSQLRRAVAKKGHHGGEGSKDHGDDRDQDDGCSALEMGNGGAQSRKREARPLLAGVADEGDAIGIKYGGKDQRDVSGKARTFQVRVPKKLLLWTMLIFLGLPLVIFTLFELGRTKTPHTDVPHPIVHNNQNPATISNTTTLSTATATTEQKDQSNANQEESPDMPFSLDNKSTELIETNTEIESESAAQQLAAEVEAIEKDFNTVATATTYENKNVTKTQTSAGKNDAVVKEASSTTAEQESETATATHENQDRLPTEEILAEEQKGNSATATATDANEAIVDRIKAKKAKTSGKLKQTGIAEAMKEKKKRIQSRIKEHPDPATTEVEEEDIDL